MLLYCDKCGCLRQAMHGRAESDEICNICHNHLKKVPLEYFQDNELYAELQCAVSDKMEQKLIKDLVLTSPNFDQYYFEHKDEIRNGERVPPNITKPSPAGVSDFLPIFLAFLVFALLCFILPSPFNIIGFLLFLITGICLGKSSHKKANDDYHLAHTDFEKYKEERIKEENEWARQHELERQRKALKNISPKCPYCGSYHTSKIGIISRGISTEMFGLASGKIGKQWHCNHCGSDF